MADFDPTTNPADDGGELLSPSTVGAYLAQRGLITDPAAARAHELGGGVSNIVLGVSAAGTRLVVKQALPRLRVADEWLAKRERAINEGEALALAGTLTPGRVPELLDLDRERCVLTIAAAPESWTTWKSRLLAGEADAAIASRIGGILADWHRLSFRNAEVERRFGDTEVFDQLRVDPYYRTVARRRPELAGAIAGLVERMEATSLCLVHGDYSPKNILVGDGVWAIDFEVAHYGDPAFDLAFMLNHLLLKRLHVGAASAALERSLEGFWSAYRDAVSGELVPDPGYVLGHVGCLMVARVEGKSPVEYLSPSEQERASAAGTRLLLDPPHSLEAALEAIDGAVG